MGNTTDPFWLLIDAAAKVSQGKNDLKEQFLVNELVNRSLQEIIDFEVSFRKAIIEADDFKVMAAQKIIDGYVSDDSYLYFRCWLISQGKVVFSETLKNPDYLANIVNTNEHCSFEELMYVATKAYSQKTGEEEDETFPREIATKRGLNYDFGAPPTKGIDWTEEELPILYPKLWAKFN